MNLTVVRRGPRCTTPHGDVDPIHKEKYENGLFLNRSMDRLARGMNIFIYMDMSITCHDLGPLKHVITMGVDHCVIGKETLALVLLYSRPLRKATCRTEIPTPSSLNMVEI